MSILDWFAKKQKAPTKAERLNIPGNLWVKCPECSEVLFTKDLEVNFKVCNHCNYHFRLTPEERLHYLFDKDSFVESDSNIGPVDVLKFSDTQKYADRIKKAKKKSNKNEAVTIGQASINKKMVNLAIMDFFFLGGSMGSAVGEKITKIIEKAVENQYPLIVFTSSGGARMQEGILSLMQMAKTSSALALLSEKKVPYITVLCDPTTGGTSASFAMLGDVQIAEPGALITFAGPRVIEQTIRQKLPQGFQRAEFLLEHGMVDMVTSRTELKETLSDLVTLLDPCEGKST
jgi:acetyl-CoA carboxylase carboxyl transferase subunit beta